MHTIAVYVYNKYVFAQRINQESFKDDPVFVFRAYNPFSLCGLWRSSLFLPPLFLSSFLFFSWEIGCCQTPTSFFGKVGRGKGKEMQFCFSSLGLGPSSFFPPLPTANFQSSFFFFHRRTVERTGLFCSVPDRFLAWQKWDGEMGLSLQPFLSCIWYYSLQDMHSTGTKI